MAEELLKFMMIDFKILWFLVVTSFFKSPPLNKFVKGLVLRTVNGWEFQFYFLKKLVFEFVLDNWKVSFLVFVGNNGFCVLTAIQGEGIHTRIGKFEKGCN
eukprot:TRINITY_DN1250_c1_g1_i2.p3 TRINITY_DN1250_c1_g1~~TRINITY_DN1250_c1_g1_i2.p3  ORF type:complete len:101 (+),score=14.62 TRINITY_DN1250_c1_g1_i2:467-769(+)